MLIGRKKEIKLFEKLLEDNHSSFCAVYGRRRVGKTYLIREYFSELEDIDFISYCGHKKYSTSQEIKRFKNVLKKNFLVNKKINNWFELFGEIESLVVNSTKDKVVIFLDEVPWLDKKRSDFLIELGDFWNNFASVRSDVILIITGSSGSWMDKMVLRDTGSFYNRVQYKVNLKPFTLKETKEYLSKVKEIHLDNNDLLFAYMHFGGIPFYLNYYDQRFSLFDNLENIFTDDFYKNEYQDLISSIFGAKKGHLEVLQKLSKKNCFIEDFDDMSPNIVNSVLNELESSNFIKKVKTYNGRKRDVFVLVDEFLLNYFKRDINESVKGLRFERIILKHSFIKGEILFNVRIDNSQLDFIVIGERDLYVIESKCKSRGLYNISGEYCDKLDKRKDQVKSWMKKMRLSKKIHMVFITVNGLSNGRYSRNIQSLSLDDLI